MQANLFKMSGITPIEFWKFTPAETLLMITQSVEKQKDEYELRASFEARLCAVIYNANGVTKKNKKPFETEDFMPTKESNHKTEEQLEMMAKMAAMRMGGEVYYHS